jgi:hypothetical protein
MHKKKQTILKGNPYANPLNEWIKSGEKWAVKSGD